MSVFVAIATWSALAAWPAPDAPARAADPGAAPVAVDGPSETMPVVAPVRERVPTESELQVVTLDASTRTPVAEAAVVAFDVEQFRSRLDERQRHGLPTDAAAREALRAACGFTARTDAAGTASVARVGATCCVEATAAGGRWGRRILSGSIEGPVEILLAVDRTVRVHVTDGAGGSVSDVPVRLGRRSAGGRSSEQRTSSPVGIATFEHAQLVLDGNDDAGVGFALPLLAPPFVAVGETPPAEPIELVLPPTGSLRVALADEHDQPVLDPRIGLNVAAFAGPERGEPLGPGGSWSRPRLDTDAVARVPWLGVGLWLRVTATSRDPDSRHKPVVVDVAGPQRAGEFVECTLRWRAAADASCPLVTGRFVRGDGTPWRGGEVMAQVLLFPMPAVRPTPLTIPVAADGRFQFVVRDSPPGGSRVYQLVAQEPPEFAGVEARLDLSRELAPGTTDVGDVVLAPGALLASGTVVDRRGAPIAGAALDVRQRVPGNNGDLWPSVECVGRFAAADGTFALHALHGMALPVAPLRLHARHNDFAEHESDLTLGATGLRVVLEPHGSLAGSVQLAPVQRPSDISVLVLRAGQGIAVAKLADDGSFTVERLAPGVVSVVISLRTGVAAERRASRREIADVVVAGGETTRDPRLQAVSIAGTAISLRVRVTDRAGKPIAHASVQAATGFDELTDADGTDRKSVV